MEQLHVGRGVVDTDPDFNLYIRISSIGALQEFKVVSGIYPAEYRTRGGADQRLGQVRDQ